MLVTSHRRRRRSAFTFVEAIFTITIIGIMASLAVSAISNASRDANRVVARQQQAAINEALQAWVMSQMRVSGSAQIQSLHSIRTNYNAQSTTSARFNLLTAIDPTSKSGFLDQSTADHFLEYSAGNSDRLKSSALESTKQYLTLPPWVAGDAPQVDMVNE
jgi:type II secretory pathway pseudopilin PulG